MTRRFSLIWCFLCMAGAPVLAQQSADAEQNADAKVSAEQAAANKKFPRRRRLKRKFRKHSIRFE